MRCAPPAPYGAERDRFCGTGVAAAAPLMVRFRRVGGEVVIWNGAMHPRRTLDPAEPEFGNATRSAARPSHEDMIATARSMQEFGRLRRRTTAFIAPVGLLFFAWYMTYAVLSAYARDWMGQPVLGSVNAGTLLGLAQFVTTAVITAVYVVYQRRRLAPLENALTEGVGQ